MENFQLTDADLLALYLFDEHVLMFRNTEEGLAYLAGFAQFDPDTRAEFARDCRNDCDGYSVGQHLLLVPRPESLPDWLPVDAVIAMTGYEKRMGEGSLDGVPRIGTVQE